MSGVASIKREDWVAKKGRAKTYGAAPLLKASNMDLGTSPRAPVIGLCASYQEPPSETSRMT